MCVWGGVFLEGGLVDFLLLSTVNTEAMDHECVVHACAHLHLCVCSCVFTFAFSRGPTCAEPDVSLPNATQALALNAFGMQCLVILSEV